MFEDDDFLNDPYKGVKNAKGVLAKLFRQALVDLNITTPLWNVKMNRYLNDPRNRIPSHSKDRSSARGNLNKELRRETMTWKVFRKALMFLGPVRATFIVRLEWPNRQTTEHVAHLIGPDHETIVPIHDEVEETQETQKKITPLETVLNAASMRFPDLEQMMAASARDNPK